MPPERTFPVRTARGLPSAALALLAALLAAPPVTADGEAICYHVASYHRGFAWTDSIERGLRTGLEGRCRIETFYLDTKRRREPARMVAAGEAAYRRMLEIGPDVVITSDDNAVRHFVEPWLLGTDTPVVFSGVNWTVEEYRLPAPNVTGMIEVAPFTELLRLGMEMTGGGRAAFLAANTLSAQKDGRRVRERARALGLSLDTVHVDSAASWRHAYRRLQRHAFVLLGDDGALADWNEGEMRRFALENARVPVLSSSAHLMPYAAIGMTRVAEEQGEWAGASAGAILGGMSPADIPLVTNRRWDSWVNEPLAERAGLTLKRSFLRSAKRVR